MVKCDKYKDEIIYFEYFNLNRKCYSQTLLKIQSWVSKICVGVIANETHSNLY